MDIWLVNPYGPIPSEGWRDYRYTMMGEALAAKGHRVIWWTANYAHHFKRFRSDGWKEITISKNFLIRLVPVSSYYKNVSFGRIRFELLYAIRLYRAASCLPAPDLIITVNPPQSTSFTALRLARKLRSRLLVDVFDLWPELFLVAFPRILRPFFKLVFKPWDFLRSYSLRHANAVMAVCDDYLSVAKKALGKVRSVPAEVFFIGVDVAEIRKNKMQPSQVLEFSQSLGKADDEIWAIYPGTIGNNYDIATLLKTSVLLEQRGVCAKIIIAGDGPLCGLVMDFVQAYSPKSLKYVGKLNPNELGKYYEVCDVGLSPYVEESTVAMPTKIYDFFAAGLPVINSLPGELARLIETRHVGLQYSPGDAESLFEALSILDNDRSKLESMSRNSYETAILFDKTSQYDRMMKFIENDVMSQHT